MSSPVRLFSPEDGDKAPCTVDQVAKRYLEEKEFQTQAGAYSEKSLIRAKYYLNDFCKLFGTNTVESCHRNDLIRWLTARKNWKATATRQDAVGNVVAAFRWAEEELGIRSPFRRPKFLGPPVQPRPAITPQEYGAIRSLLRTAKTARGRRARTRGPFRVALAFCWKTGCRTCEMREVEWREVDWARGVVVMNKHKTANKSGEARMIPVGRLLPLLRWLYKRRQPNQSKIFVNSLGRAWTKDRFASEFRRYADIAGIRPNVTAYCTRHGMCVRLLEQGVGERQVADILGHGSTKFVAWYGKTTKTMGKYLNDITKKDKR